MGTKREFFFKNSGKELIDILDNDNPIKLKYISHLVDRVHKRYPIVSKTDIAITIKTIFDSMRELLVLGKVLNFNNIFFDMQFLYFDHRRGGHILPAIKMKISTPPKLRKND